MNSDIVLKIDEIIEILDNSLEVERYKELKEELLHDEKFINEVNKVKESLNSYDNSYIELKEKIISNDKFRELKDIENDLYFMIQEINVKFKNMLNEVK